MEAPQVGSSKPSAHSETALRPPLLAKMFTCLYHRVG